MKTKRRRTGRGNNAGENYTPSNPESEAAVASSDSETVITFTFRVMDKSEAETQEDGDGGSITDAGLATEEMGTGRNVRRWTTFCFALALGSIVGDNIGDEDNPGRLHMFAFKI